MTVNIIEQSNNLLSLLGFIVSVLTLLVALYALNTWKKQMKGAGKFDVLRQLLLFSNKVELSIRKFRQPLVTLSDNSLKAEKEDKNKKYNLIVEEYLQLKNVLLQAKLFIDKDELDKVFNPFEEIIKEIRAAIWLHFEMKDEYSHIDKDPERIRENDEIIYDDYIRTKNEFTQRIKKTMSEIEEFIYQEYKKI